MVPIPTYAFLDNESIPGVNYYRIREVEKDAKSVLTNIESVEVIRETTQLTLGRNPVGNALSMFVDLPSAQAVAIKITDQNGHTILTQEKNAGAGRNSWQIDVSQLKPGLYLISINSKDLNATKRFVKI